ncbi:DUF2177 family protein [Roseisalinus antarcticus]|uniref:DUF2177 domain-containing protein n=1 Tax=Roseisalinus antarcticus TaxID=254357 RepID=A0A1Y5RAP2_9RHOB|nr:DUF2177 family protein [Roseisalinus antarcticus]SLN13044.1 hypothetical protein ROA7023_00030 [Roseisalinus antarcticus]
MSLVILYVSTTVVFLVVDALMLSNVMRPLFERHIGDWLVDGFRVAPAALFYLFYIGVVTWMVTWPALRDGLPTVAILLPAALLGAMAYGTYEFSNYATLERWHWSMVAVDLAWGTVLTAGSAWAGLAITRALT